MLERFKEFEQTINKEILENRRILGLYRNQTMDMLEVSSFEQIIDTLDYNINQLQNHLDNIWDTINYAKLGIISHHLINKEELVFIENHLRLQKINIHSEHSLFRLLKIKAYYNQTRIIFSIEMPNFDNNTFKQFLILPTVINKTYSIHIPNPYILLNDNNYQYNNGPCQEIEEYFYCEKNNLQTNNSSCIAQIILNKPAKCDIIKGAIEEKIVQIFRQYLYIQANSQMDYATNCEIQNKKYLTGIQLIKFVNCTVTINNTKYENCATTFSKNILNLEPYHDIKIRKIITPIETSTLKNWTINNLAEIKQITVSNTHHFISWTFSNVLIIIIIIYLLYLKGYIKMPTLCKNKISSQFNLDDHKISVSRSSLRGEELHPHPTQQQQSIIMTLHNNKEDV